jgi:hypothetical protein
MDVSSKSHEELSKEILIQLSKTMQAISLFLVHSLESQLSILCLQHLSFQRNILHQIRQHQVSWKFGQGFATIREVWAINKIGYGQQPYRNRQI